MEINQVEEILEKTYDDFQQQLRYAENKNHILMVFMGIILAAMSIFFQQKITEETLAIKILIIITSAVALFTLIIILFSLLPKEKINKLEQKNNKIKNPTLFNVYYYKSWIASEDYCIKKIKEKFNLDKNYLFNLDLIYQLRIYSYIINRKYFYSKIIIICSIFTIILFVITIIIFVF